MLKKYPYLFFNELHIYIFFLQQVTNYTMYKKVSAMLRLILYCSELGRLKPGSYPFQYEYFTIFNTNGEKHALVVKVTDHES